MWLTDQTTIRAAIATPRTLDHRRPGLRRIAAIAMPGRAMAKDLRPMEVNELSTWTRGN